MIGGVSQQRSAFIQACRSQENPNQSITRTTANQLRGEIRHAEIKHLLMRRRLQRQGHKNTTPHG